MSSRRGRAARSGGGGDMRSMRHTGPLAPTHSRSIIPQLPPACSLYHQDNFKGQLRSRLGDLVGSRGYEITGTRQQHGGDGEPESVVVTARVQGSVSGTAALYEFTLRRKLVGPRKGAWTTYSLVAAEA